ncbi:MAG TPA: heme biosynthesis HemY N-terminal domain-containing protein [Pseudolabrys sp.]|nr:heme biosynthesis HemY N-terminal domain-containing protein [Pseudolabrys sp.]
MIRVLLFLIVVGAAAWSVAALANLPGDVVITWLGYHIETSVMVMLGAIAILVACVILLLWIARAIYRSPEQVSLFLRNRRAMKGYLAISRGLIAIGSGHAHLARRSADEAKRLAPHEPLALLLSAQSAQLSGNRTEAEAAFRAMVARPDTKLLGLRGLYMEAQRRNDMDAARLAAEEAAQTAPALTWASQAVLDFRSAAGDWSGALEVLERMKSTLDKALYRRQRAVLLTARALALEESDRDAARAAILEAVKLAPSLVPAAVLAGRRLAEAGELRKAARIIEAAWKAHPHPDLAETYANLRFGDSARDRLARVQALVAKGQQGIESALAVARAALDAREFAAARAALKPHLSAATQRLASLMAEIEEIEHGDEGRVREWTARALRAAPDPQWSADGVVSDRWMPVSPATGRLDAFQWKLPVAEIGIERPVIEVEPAPRESTEIAVETPKPASARAEPPPTKAPPRPKPVPPVEAVIPLVHVPDDPGPDQQLEADPVPEPTTPSGGWRRLFR